nr:hypothetical protein GCM10020063_032050 [Dactylosporangium thailandense]
MPVCVSSAAAPSAIATGHENVADSGPHTCRSACCTTRAPGPPRVAGLGKVRQRDHAVTRRRRPLRLPAGRGVDPLDPLAPPVEAGQRRRVRLGVVMRGAQRPEHLRGQVRQALLRGRVPVLAQKPVQPAAQLRIRSVRVTQRRAGLHESRHG